MESITKLKSKYSILNFISPNIFSIFIFCTFTAIIQYAFVWEADTMDNSLYYFIYNFTSKIDKEGLKYLRSLAFAKRNQKEEEEKKEKEKEHKKNSSSNNNNNNNNKD